MLAVLTALKSKVTGYILAGVAVIGILLGVYRAGQKSTKATVAEDSLRQVATKAEIDAEVSGMSASSARDELRKWANK